MIRRPPRSTRVRSSAASDVYKRQGQAVRLLFGVLVTACQHQQVVGDVGLGRPDLLAVEDPAAFGLLGSGPHRAEDVGATTGLGHRDGELLLAGRDVGEEALLLLFAAVVPDRLGPGEGVDAPNPADATEVA